VRIGRRCVLYCLVFGLLLASCANRVNTELVYEGTRSSYKRILYNWTRGDKVYKGVDCVMQVKATLVSPQMEDALNSERARTHGPSGDTYDKQRNVLGLSVRPEVHLVLISMYTKAKNANDLSRNPSSWTVWLVNGNGVSVRAESIIQVKIKPEELKELLPYLEKGTRAYMVLFPTVDEDGRAVWSDDTSRLSCVISGPLGRAKMHWEFTTP